MQRAYLLCKRNKEGDERGGKSLLSEEREKRIVESPGSVGYLFYRLRCEAGTQSEGAIKWVNRNLVNVAVTRARHRLYVIGDKDAWKWKPCMQVVEKRIEEFEDVPGKEGKQISSGENSK